MSAIGSSLSAIQAVRLIERWTKPELQTCIRNINASPTQQTRIKTQGNKAILIQNLLNHLDATFSSADCKKKTQLLDCILPNSNRHNYNYNHINNNTNNSFRNGSTGYNPHNSLHFKSSPFHIINQQLGHTSICTASERKTVVYLNFRLNSSQVALLKRSNEIYKIQLFCCSNEANRQEALVEFPNLCLIKVNKNSLNTNLRGLKNRPGTVHPQDITKFCKIDPSYENKIEFHYENTTKDYILMLHLVKKVMVEEIINKIKNGKYVSKETILEKFKKSHQDSDVIATSSMISLKDTLAHTRITLPCRSIRCDHLQCFDAYSFLKMNEQTPTWTCPICYKILDSWEEIVVDGFFNDILANTPAEQDHVTIEADGSWAKAKRTHKNDSDDVSSAMVSPAKKTKLSQQIPQQRQIYTIDSSDSGDDSSGDDDSDSDSDSSGSVGSNNASGSASSNDDDDSDDGYDNDKNRNGYRNSKKNIVNGNRKSKHPNRKPEPVFIDLTQSSDEEVDGDGTGSNTHQTKIHHNFNNNNDKCKYNTNNISDINNNNMCSNGNNIINGNNNNNGNINDNMNNDGNFNDNDDNNNNNNNNHNNGNINCDMNGNGNDFSVFDMELFRKHLISNVPTPSSLPPLPTPLPLPPKSNSATIPALLNVTTAPDSLLLPSPSSPGMMTFASNPYALTTTATTISDDNNNMGKITPTIAATPPIEASDINYNQNTFNDLPHFQIDYSSLFNNSSLSTFTHNDPNNFSHNLYNDDYNIDVYPQYEEFL